MAATGVYAYHNIKQLNRYQTSDEVEKFSADYETQISQIREASAAGDHQGDAERAAVPEAAAAARQRPLRSQEQYQRRRSATSTSARAIDDTVFTRLEVTGAHLVSYDNKFGYRIYRFDTPLAPGATAAISVHVTASGAAASGRRRPATDIIENGTFANNSDFAPVIGMSRQGLLSDRAKRRRQGLPPELRPAKLEDMSATAPQLYRQRLDDLGHHADHRRRPDADRAGQPGFGRDGQRPPHGAFRQRRADPQFLLDPVGRLSSRDPRPQRPPAVRSITTRATTGTSPRC